MVVYDDIAENKIAIFDKGIDRMAILDKIWILTSLIFPLLTTVQEMLFCPKLISRASQD